MAQFQTIDHDAQAARQAMDWVLQGERERAAVHLHRTLGSRVLGYLRRHRVPDQDAEELVTDIWMKFLCSRYEEQVRPVVWLWMIARSVLIDWVRARTSQKRAGADGDALEIELDAQTLETIAHAAETADAPAWLRLCIERAARQLELDDPNRAHVLWLWYSGQSAAEIAVVFGAKPPPNAKQEAAARNRVLEAVRKARAYFQHCKD